MYRDGQCLQARLRFQFKHVCTRCKCKTVASDSRCRAKGNYHDEINKKEKEKTKKVWKREKSYPAPGYALTIQFASLQRIQAQHLDLLDQLGAPLLPPEGGSSSPLSPPFLFVPFHSDAIINMTVIFPTRGFI